MRNEITIRITGQAGQGMQTIGNAMVRMFKQAGLHVFSNQDYMSRIRGGNNYFQIRVSTQPVFALRQQCDIIVVLDKTGVPIHQDSLSEHGVLIVDKEQFGISDPARIFYDIRMAALTKDLGGNGHSVNSIASGALAALTGVSFSIVASVMNTVFAAKGEETLDANVRMAKAGYDAARQDLRDNAFMLPQDVDPGGLLMNANEAIGLAAICAGCKFYSAYPMTPSTEIMETIARYAGIFNIMVEQAEDEIAAINMVVGASFAGVRAMTASSGGGFALMTEGLSLAGMTETPVVVVDGQRPAPATGLPTRTEQADLDLLINAGHGEFARVVYSPGTVEEAFSLTIDAFNLAEKYQIPVLILTDQHLADSVRNIKPLSLSHPVVIRHIIPKEQSEGVVEYKRYAFTEEGISPRAVPSWIPGVVYSDSDEHTEEGHITEDPVIRRRMVEKRLYRKMELLQDDIKEPLACNMEGAETVLVGFGSTCGVVREATQVLKGRNIGCIHLSQVWPFPAQAMKRLLKSAKKILTIENNAGAQLAGLLRRQTGIAVHGSILKFDGRPFDLDYLLDKLTGEAH